MKPNKCKGFDDIARSNITISDTGLVGREYHRLSRLAAVDSSVPSRDIADG
jgi:hypothetical protein